MLIYNVPAAALTKYRDKTITVRSDDARTLAEAFSTVPREKLSSLKVLSLDCDADVLLHMPDSAAIDLVVNDPAAGFGKLYRFAELANKHWVRATVRAVPGMTKAVKIAQALNFSVKLEIGQPEATEVDELIALAEYFLRGSTANHPIEPFHSLFLSFLSNKAASLWGLQEEDPFVDRYVTGDGTIAFSKRLVSLDIPENLFSKFLEQHMSACLDADGCAGCKFFSRCRGFFKLPEKTYQCEHIKKLFAMLDDAAEEMKRDEKRFVELYAPSSSGNHTTVAPPRKCVPQDAGSYKTMTDPARKEVPSSFSIQRLNCRLEEFTRLSWANDEAKAIWEPRISRIVNSMHELEWRSILGGLRACALTSVPPDELKSFSAKLATHGLTIATLEKIAVQDTYANCLKTPQDGEPFHYWCAIGQASDVKLFESAFLKQDDKTMGLLLGYPSCCVDFFKRAWVDEEFIDTTWPMAQNTTNKRHISPTHIEITEASSCNALLRWLGPRIAIHLPCSFDCKATITLADKLFELARSEGFHQEMDWMQEMLSWPVEWTALNGVAEITTPLGTMSTVTDATAEAYRVSYRGSGNAKADGVRQAFEPTIVRISDPYDDSVDRHFEDQEWYYADNGFFSKQGMDSCHEPIVALATETLSQATGNVLDLGCGNGVLLKRICLSNSNLIPWGIDRSSTNIEHARQLVPGFADNFAVADIFDDSVAWSQEREFELVILSLIHLYHVPEEYAEKLLGWAGEHTRNLLLYAYAGADVSLEELAQKAGITLPDKQSEENVTVVQLRQLSP